MKIEMRVDMLKLRRTHISKVIYSLAFLAPVKKVYDTRQFDRAGLFKISFLYPGKFFKNSLKNFIDIVSHSLLIIAVHVCKS